MQKWIETVSNIKSDTENKLLTFVSPSREKVLKEAENADSLSFGKTMQKQWLWEQSDMVRCTIGNIMVKCRTEELLQQQNIFLEADERKCY